MRRARLLDLWLHCNTVWAISPAPVLSNRQLYVFSWQLLILASCFVINSLFYYRLLHHQLCRLTLDWKYSCHWHAKMCGSRSCLTEKVKRGKTFPLSYVHWTASGIQKAIVTCWTKISSQILEIFSFFPNFQTAICHPAELFGHGDVFCYATAFCKLPTAENQCLYF